MPDDPVTCSNPNCRVEIGKLVMVGDLQFLLLGGALCRQAHGVCACCGKEFHWSVSDKQFEMMVIQSKKP